MTRQLYIFAFICFFCVANALAATTPESNQCYTCRGINCLRTTAQEVTETCLSELDVCATIFDKFAVIAKGCLLNIPIELRRKCQNHANPECQICVGGLCNNLGREDFKCYQCDQNDDVNCSDNVSALTPVQCKIPSAPNSYCFAERTETGRIRRGCSLHVKDQKECLAREECHLCSAEDGQACNAAFVGLPSGCVMQSATVALVMLCAAIARMIL